MIDLSPLHIIFYAFSAVAVSAAMAVITFRNPVRSVLSLVVTFFAMAAIWMMLRAEFLALILILVYVGAVMTLFLFVIMLLNIDREFDRSGFVRYLPFAIILVVVLVGLILFAIGPQYFGLTATPLPPIEASNYSNIQELGAVLYTEYAYPFEIAGVLLLAAIIAAITLTYRGPIRRRVQNAKEQLDVNPADRVQLVNLKPGAGLNHREDNCK